MRNHLLKSIFISLILMMGISNAWADIAFSGGYIYFDNSIGINQKYIQLCARQSSWTGVSTMTNISNTKLYYVADPQGSGWGGILGWVVIGNSTAKTNSNFDNWSTYGWCSNWNTYGFNSGSTYLIVPSSTEKSKSVTTSYYSGGFSALNSQQTIKSAVNGADANSKATISITSYKMTGNGTVTKQEATLGTGAKDSYIDAARTATTTLTVGSVAAGYKFDGWYTAATSGTELSTYTTYTYYPTAATTIYARFSEITYYVAGTFNDWKEADAKNKMTLAGGIYTKTLTLPAGEHKLKVTNGTWNNPSPWGYDHLPKELYYEGVTTDNDKNIVINLTNSTEITINFNSTTSQITIDGLVSKEHIYTIVGPAAMLGTDWDLFAESNKMTKQDENTFVLVKEEVILAEGDYQYKAVRNNSYSWEVPQGDNKTLRIEESGRGKVTFTLKPYEYTLEAKVSDWVPGEVDQTVVLTGINENVEFTFTEAPDSKSTSAEIILEANQVYAFNIIVNGTWMYNTGNMWRDNCNAWTFEIANINNEAHIITDIAGTYTFTWTYEGNKLSVKYPDGTNVPAPVFLGGDMNEWSWTKTRLIPSVDGKTASATINLTDVKTYNFKIKVGDTYLGNNGEMNREYHENWIFREKDGENDEKNAQITTDIIGNYTFTWTYETNALTVTYPEMVTEPEVYTRTVTAGNYGTICLPYGSSNYTGAEFYEVSWLKEGTGLYLDQLEADAQLVAGKPYIFKATDSEITVTYTGEAVTAPITGTNGLTGTFEDIAANTDLVGHYIIAQNKIWLANDQNTLPANRAYIANTVPTTEQPKLAGRRRVCMGENAATGLDNITNGENTTIKVIENGQLFIIRNGEKFNAQGQKL